MSVDHVLRAIGTLASLYTVGMFVTLMSLSALSSAGTAGHPFCSDAGCHMASYEPPQAGPIAGPGFLHTAALFISSPI